MSTDDDLFDDSLEELYKSIGLSRPTPRPPRRRRSEVAKALRDTGASPPPHPLARSGPRLKALREASGWTVEEIAERTGVPLDVLTKFEQGDSDAAEEVTLADLERLASACCGSMEDIVTPEARREAKRREDRRKPGRSSIYDPFSF